VVRGVQGDKQEKASHLVSKLELVSMSLKHGGRKFSNFTIA
jgi:hypothetical protein